MSDTRLTSHLWRRRARLFCGTTVIVWSVVTAGGQGADSAVFPERLRAHLQAERFGIVTSVRGLPLGVRDALQALFGSPTLEIAEPGAPFQATDSIVDRTLPSRRLIAAGCSADHCLVYYERGGRARRWQVALFHWTPTATRLEWGGIAPRGLQTLDELRKAILSGAVKGPAKDWEE